MNTTNIGQLVITTVTSVGLRVVGALVLWIVGRMLIALVARGASVQHEASGRDGLARTLREAFRP